jgi:hypothetical protein
MPLKCSPISGASPLRTAVAPGADQPIGAGRLGIWNYAVGEELVGVYPFGAAEVFDRAFLELQRLTLAPAGQLASNDHGPQVPFFRLHAPVPGVVGAVAAVFRFLVEI